jgi:hypothetical protein
MKFYIKLCNDLLSERFCFEVTRRPAAGYLEFVYRTI